jgi:hypothetical protein
MGAAIVYIAACLLAMPVLSQLAMDDRGYFRNGSKLFIPIGVNYWPSSSGCNVWSAQEFPAAEIQHDFDVLAGSPFDTVRIFLTWGDLASGECQTA